MSNQWLSTCSVNNSDEMGQPGDGSAAEKNFNLGTTACSVKGALQNSIMIPDFGILLNGEYFFLDFYHFENTFIINTEGMK